MKEKDNGCVLCAKQDELEPDRAKYVLYRGKTCFLMMNLYPYTNGHLMVVPYEHIADLEKLSKEAAHEMVDLAQRSIGLLKKVLQPHGFNLGMNLGRVAGAGVADHLHLHVVPRWEGDVNFMSVLADTRLIPEALDATYDKLLAVIKEEKWE